MKRLIVACLVALGMHAPPAPGSAQTVHMWSDGFGWSSYDQPGDVAFDAAGNVYLAGAFQGAVNFGGGYRISAGERDVFVAKFAGDGSHIWSKHFGDANADIVYAIDVDANGNVAVAGAFEGSIDFGSEGSAASAGMVDMFVAVFDPNGTLLWARFAGSTQSDHANGVAFDPVTGGVIVTGGFLGTVNFGGGNLTSAGDAEIFLVSYNNAGQHVWSKRFGSTGADNGNAVVVDASGGTYLGGIFSGTVDFGGGNVASGGLVDVVLAKYNSSGAHQWSHGFGSVGSDIANGLALDGNGGVFVSGSFEGTVGLGGASLVSAGASDIFLARFTPGGSHQWSQRFGSTDYDRGYAVARNGFGDVVLAGRFVGAVDFGGGALVSAGQGDVFVAKYDSTGVHRSSYRYGANAEEYATGIAADATGGVVVTGNFDTSIDFGGGAIAGLGTNDIFVARFAEGVVNPLITSIVDVPADEGRLVRVSFERSAHDDAGSPTQVNTYEIYRRDDPAPLAGVSATREAGRVVTAEGWTYVGAAPAHGELGYTVLAPTIGDSTVVGGDYNSTFFVRAATIIPTIFYDSAPDSGYSRDNLAPLAPAGLLHDGALLAWDESAAADFDYFSVYGSDTGEFSAATVIGNTTLPSLNVAATPHGHYFVTATDHSGNESDAAALDLATGVETASSPSWLAITAHPNPFNPNTTVTFTMPADGRVSVRIYDVRGVRVRTLVDNAVRAAGIHRVRWNGVSASGTVLPSGVYFLRIDHDGASRTRKIVMLK